MLIENLTNLIDEKKEGNSVSTLLKINGDHALFEGHFPRKPIVPGVVLLQLLKEQAERFSRSKLILSKAFNIKFLSTINPIKNHEIQLETTFQPENDTFTAVSKISHEGKICAKAKLIFKYQ